MLLTSDMENDVTGGIRAKLNSAINIVLDGNGLIPVVFCSLATSAFENITSSGLLETAVCTILQMKSIGDVAV